VAISPLLPLVTSDPNQGWGSSGRAFVPTLPSPPSSSERTALQALEQYLLAQRLKKKKRSMLGRALHGTAGGVGAALDFIARPSYAVAEGTRRALEGEGNDIDVGDFLSGAWAGLSGKKKTGFGQVLDEHGILDSHKFLRGTIGLGLDIATDPTMLLSLAAVPVTGGASLSVVGTRLAQKGLTTKQVADATKLIQHGSDDVTELIKARDILTTAGDGYTARAGLANLRIQETTLRADPRYADQLFTPARQSELHAAQAWARTEADRELKKVLSFQYKIPFAKKTTDKYWRNGRLVVRTPIPVGSLKGVADLGERAGLLGKIPVVPGIAEHLGRAFKPGWRNEKFHSLERVGRATVELREREYLASLAGHLSPFINKRSEDFLTIDEQLQALDFGENAKGIVQLAKDSEGTIRSRRLNEGMVDAAVQAGTLSDKQGRFIKSWHGATNVLFHADLDYGRNYGAVLKSANKDGQDVLYVPHMYTKDGRKLNQLGSTILTTPGFEFERLANKPTSVKDLAELHATGTYRDLVETDPSKLLAIRARRGAQSHADRMIENILAAAEGIPTRIPNAAAIKKRSDEIDFREGELGKLKLATDAGYNRAVGALKAKAFARTRAALTVKRGAFDAKERQLNADVRRLQATVRRNKVQDAIPSPARLVTMSHKDFNKVFPPSAKKLFPIRLKALKSRRLHQAAAAAEARAKNLKASVGEKPHGSQYKALTVKLLSDIKKDLPTAAPDGTLYKQIVSAKFKRGETWKDRLEEATSAVKGVARADWQRTLDQINWKPSPRNIQAQIATKKKALANHRSRREAMERKVDEDTAKWFDAQKAKLDTEAAKQRARAKTHTKLIATAERKIAYHQKSVKNPEAYKPGFLEVDKLKAANGAPLAIPVEMADALKRIREVIHDDQFMADLARTWARLTGRWKVAVTVVNPGYRVRNTISDGWNMYISPEGGVPLWAMGKYGMEAARLMHRLSRGDAEAARIFQEAYEHSVMSGLFGGDVEQVLRTLRGGLKGDSAKEQLKDARFIKAYTTFATNFNRDAENWGRLTHYLYRRQYQKMAPAEAASIVRIAHFDYEDLTKFERKVKGNLAPFYTWTRNNIPYQLKQMVMAPGKYSVFSKLRNEMEYASGDEGIAPDWIKGNFGFQVPWGDNTFFAPQFGPSDLGKVASPKGFLSLLHPGVKAPAELAFNKSLLTDAPIYGSELSHPRTPISGWAAKMLSNIPGTNVGTTARQVDGETMRGPGASPLISYLAAQIPMTNVAVNQMSNIRQAQRGQGRSLVSYLGGLSTFSPDPEQTLGIAEQDWNKAFAQYVRGLRDEGRWPEPERNTSDYQEERRRFIRQLLRDNN